MLVSAHIVFSGFVLIMAALYLETASPQDAVVMKLLATPEAIAQITREKYLAEKYGSGALRFKIMCSQKGVWNGWDDAEKAEWVEFAHGRGKHEPINISGYVGCFR